MTIRIKLLESSISNLLRYIHNRELKINHDESSITVSRYGLIGTFPPPYGGVSIHIKALKSFLDQKGIVSIIYNTGRNKNIVCEQVENVISLADLFKKLFFSQADILHAHGGVDLYKKLFIILLIKVLKGKKYIVTVHSGGIVEDLKRKNCLYQRILTLLFNNAERIICVSEKIKNVLTEIGIIPQKCIVIPAFSIDVSLKSIRLCNDMSNFINHHSPLLSCLGFSFQPHYGFDLAISAINVLRNKYPKIGLIIIGADKREVAFQQLIHMFNSESLKDIYFSGGIDHKQVLAIIKESNIFIRPTFHDGDANSVREAISIKTPVIASDAETRPNGVILFKKGNLKDLIEKIDLVLKTNKLKKTKSNHIVDVANLEAVFNVYRAV